MRTKVMFAALVIVVFTAWVSLKSANAALYDTDLTFQTSDQSMWATGPATVFDFNRFLGLSWDESKTVGGITEVCVPLLGCGSAGAEARGSTDGQIGFNLGVHLDSGSVNVTYPVGIQLVHPDPGTFGPGSTFPVSSSFVVNPGATMTTNFPEIQAFTDLKFDVFASLGGEICAGGCVGGDKTLINVDKTQEILAFNRNGDGELRVLGSAPNGFQFGQPFAVAGGFGEVTLFIPDINTTGALAGTSLQSSGRDDLATLEVDIDKIATTLLGAPPLEGSTDIFGITASFNILDIQAGPDFDILQSFLFNPKPTVRLTLEPGGRYLIFRSAAL